MTSYTKQAFDDAQSATQALWDAYANSADYGKPQSASYKAYMDSRKQQNAISDALYEQQALNYLKAHPSNKSPGTAYESYLGDASGSLQADLEARVAAQGGGPANGWAQQPQQPAITQAVNVPFAKTGQQPQQPAITQAVNVPFAKTGQQQLPMQMTQGANLGMGGGNWGSYAYQKNPYLDSMASNITNQVNDNWNRNLAPTIRSGAIQNGSYGGSRQGVVEANALKDVNSGLTNALTNMYGQDYQTSMGRNLQRYQGDQSYDLGLRNNDLGFSNLDFQINQGNVNNQLAGANLGMNTWGTQQQGNQAGITAGTNIQNTPYNNWSNFNTAANNVGQGLASNTTNQDAQGNPILGALGGWQLGTKIAGNLGFGPPVSDGGYSMGLGSAYGGNRQGM